VAGRPTLASASVTKAVSMKGISTKTNKNESKIRTGKEKLETVCFMI
jgi:hypothetical protein